MTPPKKTTDQPSASGLRPASKAKKAAPKKAADDTAAFKKKESGAVSGIRIRLSAFDHRVLDEAAAKILDTAERSGAVVHGPIPLPTKIRKFTVNKSTFVHKNSRDQYEMRIHRRLIDLTETTFKTVESLQSLCFTYSVVI
jgi:small subunit ribosomal protein S10